MGSLCRVAGRLAELACNAVDYEAGALNRGLELIGADV
jgi:hypothetical protein